MKPVILANMHNGKDSFFTFSTIDPTVNVTMTNDKINPPVGLISCTGPAVIPANTGTPETPMKIYAIIARDPRVYLRIKPDKIAKHVCSDIGTADPPIGRTK